MTVTQEAPVKEHKLWFTDLHDLIRVMSNSLLYASRDSTLPTLAAVRFEFDGTKLELMASDRYQAFIEEISLNLSDDASRTPFEFNLSGEAMRATLAFLKANRRVPVTLKFDSETSRIRFDGFETSIEYRALDTKFPPIRQLFPSPNTGKAVKRISFTAAFLANLGKVVTGQNVRRPGATILTFGEHRPVLIEFPEGPRILIMPSRRTPPVTDS